MKFLVLLIVSFIVCSCGGERSNRGVKKLVVLTKDLRARELKGRVKLCKVIEYHYEIENQFYVKKLTRQFSYQFDCNGSIQEINLHEIKGVQRQIYLYNDKDLNNELDILDSNNNLVMKDINLFDDQNQCIQTTNFKADGRRGSITKYKYDEHGNRIESVYIDSNDKEHSTSKFMYDKENNAVVEKCYWDNKLQVKIVAKYDNDYNVIEYSNVFLESDPHSYVSYSTYQDFDKAGNWLKSISYIGKVPDKYWERIIEYY